MNPQLPQEIENFILINPYLDSEKLSFAEKVFFYLYLSPIPRNSSHFKPELWKYIWEPHPDLVQDQCLPISRIMFAQYQVRSDLQRAFDLNTPDGRRAFVDWFLAYAVHTLFKTGGPKIEEVDPTFLINTIGYFGRDFGLGHMSGLVREGLGVAGIRSSFTDVENCPVFHKNSKIQLFSMPAMEAFRMNYSLGPDLFQNSYNIFYSPWELSHWSTKLNFCFSQASEIWLLSSFNKEAFFKVSGKPVEVFNLPVEVPEIDLGKASRWMKKDGVEDPFVFLSVFDAKSYLQRKNPFATIRAFQEAFKKDENVKLIFKVTDLNVSSREGAQFQKMISGDPRILCINENLNRDELYALMGSCDAYVSLHRAEGYGLTIAECMAMGKPAICTGYSGNMDFTNSENSFLVDYQLIPVKPQEYHFVSEQSEWADPSVASAAEKMLFVYKNQEAAREVGLRGKEYVERHLNKKIFAERVGNRIRQVMRVKNNP